MHANNNELIGDRENLVDVIDKLGEKLEIPKEDIDKLHLGRKFLNMIKHYDKQFPSWEIANIAFEEAFYTLHKYQILI